jgi:hypothetical protein
MLFTKEYFMKQGFLVIRLGILGLGAVSVFAGPALVRIERQTRQDRNVLLRKGVPLIKEFETFLLAWDEGDGLAGRIRAMGFRAQAVDHPAGPAAYHILAYRGPGPDLHPFAGEIVWREENLILLRTAATGPPAFLDSTQYRWQPLSLEPLHPSWMIPSRTVVKRQMSDPRIQAVLDVLTDDSIVALWEGLIGAADTRYSENAGCFEAADWAMAQFASFGIHVEKQDYSHVFAPNVVATLPGQVHPEKKVVMLAHLDDMPPNRRAPGADDNASGSAMVLALARALSRQAFENTLVFLLVTGEEQGLVGST